MSLPPIHEQPQKDPSWMGLNFIAQYATLNCIAPTEKWNIWKIMLRDIIKKMERKIKAVSSSTFLLTLFRMRGAKKAAPTSFSFVTSAKVGNRPRNWILFLSLLPLLCKISSSYLVPVPNYWTWTKTTPQKKRFFWSNPYKIEVIITSLTEMLELPNFGCMTTFT